MAMTGEGPLFLLGLHIPLWRKQDSLHQIVHLHVDHCRIFASATRAPFMLVYETVNLDDAGESIEESSDLPRERSISSGSQQHFKGSGHQSLLHQSATAVLPAKTQKMLASCALKELQIATATNNEVSLDDTSVDEDCEERLRRLIKEVTPEQWRSHTSTFFAAPTQQEPQAEDFSSNISQNDDSASSKSLKPKDAAKKKRKEEAIQTRNLIWGETWKEKTERIRQTSPYRHYPSWELNAVMVKGGDDLRQELLASQIIEQFSAIWQEAGLPLWLKATKVLVTSSESGFLEFIHDSTSIDGMKKLFPGKSLGDIFKVAFADNSFEAKKNFIESTAAYSLVVYFLQVKDRHNGNLMLLSSGHIVHIDFGFMLSNSPGGNMAFENSPFKLTQEILDVMDGECSEQYEYFRTLLIRGFLEARKHMERIILQVRMMLTGSKMPCFREGSDFVLQTLQDRFFANLTEEACIEKVVDLIDTSVNNWRTIQYDNYQRFVNGIL
eukprot:TRINITY_DN33073_c0_g1_i1.p1 TRINITY_DN33073_c0_g1~~TRINITY_DN33073_c0_g1_i1.p1  ORF type:complete len:538 (-),score=108.36 TRINITY_DN33073_c0_g1_i1:45-1532(-)